MIIKLVRHGESEANTGNHIPHDQGDFCVNLTPHGIGQAKNAAKDIGRAFLTEALIYCSPYWRTRQTLDALLSGLDQPPSRIYEDPRLREVERGYINDTSQYPLRKIHGWFYYRHQGGESPADCYDRTSNFLESMMRNRERKHVEKILIVSHGMTIRCFVMRFLHLTVEQFENIRNPDNGSVVTIGPLAEIENPIYKTKKWGVTGLKLRSDQC